MNQYKHQTPPNLNDQLFENEEEEVVQPHRMSPPPVQNNKKKKLNVKRDLSIIIPAVLSLSFMIAIFTNLPARQTYTPEPTITIRSNVDEDLEDAINSAEIYADSLHMSYDGIFDQLTSKYGNHYSEEIARQAVDALKVDWNENALKKAKDLVDQHYSEQGIYEMLSNDSGYKYTKEQAQYAIDHLEVDWNEQALEQAKYLSNTLHLSERRMYKHLTSSSGSDKFTKEQADYAIAHLDVDWNTNALRKAKDYGTDRMDKDRMFEQLTSEYGEMFTEEQAQYAIDQLY